MRSLTASLPRTAPLHPSTLPPSPHLRQCRYPGKRGAPQRTRWFEGDPASIRWITTTAGQRAVTMEDGASTPTIVRGFNPYAVHSAQAQAAAGGHLHDWIEDLPNGNVMRFRVDDSLACSLRGLCSRRCAVVVAVRRGCDSGGIPLPRCSHRRREDLRIED